MMLTQERLRELVTYNPLTGEFTRISKICNRKAGERAGWLDTINGYRRMTLDKCQHSEHRLVFLYMEGKFPLEVDHINRIKDDNRWENLRESNRRENNENRIDNNSFIGVQFHKPSQKWTAVTSGYSGKRRNIGSFTTHLAACYARWVYDQECLCL